MWCTFDGWVKKANETNQLELLSKLINLVPNNKIILMHGGGPNLLKFYEKFRFINNVFLDLSYTLVQFQKTSLEKDIIFLMNKFDKRIIVGCDYPTFNLNTYLSILRRLLKISKINKNKKQNILKNNIKKIING
jgi:predicted TIM-barrel fold metal-dependent hydrolase